MTHVPLLDELAIIALLSVLVSVVLARLRLPTVAGLLLVGALAGPDGLGLVRSYESIETLAEIGVVLLLFTIGLEFSLSRLARIARQVAIGGSIQVGLTTLAVIGVAAALGRSFSQGLFFGFVFALSSTAIVLRGLSDRRELDAPHGRFIVGALIFQDLCVVPMVLMVPLLGKPIGFAEMASAIGLALTKATAVVVGTMVVARFVVPRLLVRVEASRSREVFLLAVLGLCIGTAWLTSLAGLSLALGAFLGGMVVADTEFGHRAMGDVLPLRDAFVSVFFVSLGMLFDIRAVLLHPIAVAAIFFGVLVGKGVLASLAAMAMRFPARPAFLAGVGLAQFGEFGFVLVKLGAAAGIVGKEDTRVVLAAGIGTMFVTPLLVQLAPRFRAGERMLAPLERLIGADGIDTATPAETDALHGHVVVVGYGVAGKLVASALETAGVRYVVLELDADNARKARAAGRPVYYADATSPEALAHAHVESAVAVVLMMNDPSAIRRTTDVVRRVAADVPIVVRTHYLGETAELTKLGATDVITEEVEAGVELVARVLRRLEIPRNVIDACVLDARATTTETARKTTIARPRLGDSRALADLRIENTLIQEGSRAAGCTPAELELRSRTGALLVALHRDGVLVEGPDPSAPLAAGDVVYLVGSAASVREAIHWLDGGREA